VKLGDEAEVRVELDAVDVTGDINEEVVVGFSVLVDVFHVSEGEVEGSLSVDVNPLSVGSVFDADARILLGGSEDIDVSGASNGSGSKALPFLSIVAVKSNPAAEPVDVATGISPGSDPMESSA
jgi:hypothetical protein